MVIDFLDSYRKYIGDVTLSTVWSRSQQAAENFVKTVVADFAPDAAVMHGESGMQAILDDPAIDGVVIVLPVQVALEVGEWRDRQCPSEFVEIIIQQLPPRHLTQLDPKSADIVNKKRQQNLDSM